MTLNTENLPLVTVILPIRNEARHIARCLDAVSSQDYPRERMEILVVDGMSDDGTRAIVARAFERWNVGTLECSRARLLDNPERIVPTALNRGIRQARGSVIIRVDGHTVIARDYVRKCVEVLATTQADNVGGPMNAVGQTLVAQAIAIASSSRFGVGSALFHYADEPGCVDTVYMGAYRREVFDRIGLFDEELVRNQDDEFNYRLTRSGGKIWLDPEICSDYFSRATLRGLWKQYLEYGFWKVRVIRKHGRPASWRHLVPGAFVLALLGSSILGLLVQSPLYFFAVLLSYLFVSLSVSLWLAARRGWRYATILPVAFATMHVAYGVGFLTGLVRFGLNRPVPVLSRREGGLDSTRSDGIVD
jgi:succinoglycan biosynthesis protein ExoA